MNAASPMDFWTWREAITKSFVPLRTETDRCSDFTASMNVSAHATMSVSTIEAQPHAVRRTTELIKNDQMQADIPAYYKVSLQLRGHGVLLQDGREVELVPGTMAIYDTSRPYVLNFDSAFQSHIVMFSHDRLSFSQDGIQEVTATPIGSGRQLSKMSARIIADAAEVLPSLQAPLADRVGGNVVDIINTLIADELLEAHDTKVSRRQKQVAQIRHFIDQHLADPDLSVSTVAAAHHMSIRSLQYLFENEGENVSDFIRKRRLEKIQIDLRDPSQRELPVATIGSRWGFVDPAYFSRVFRQTVGMPPTAYRDSN